MRYIKCFFQLIKWVRDGKEYSCYAYTTSPYYTASAFLNGISSKFNVTIRSSSSTDTSSDTDEDYTIWLSDEDRKALNKTEAFQYRDIFGSVAYLSFDADNQMNLVSSDDFNQLPADERSNLVTSLHLEA